MERVSGPADAAAVAAPGSSQRCENLIAARSGGDGGDKRGVDRWDRSGGDMGGYRHGDRNRSLVESQRAAACVIVIAAPVV
jgi:hypothetical protein